VPAGPTPTVAAQVLTGPGGVGKSRLAVEYSYAHRGDFDVVWWTRAEQATTLRGDLAGLGRELALNSACGSNLNVAVKEVRAWLADHDRWLVVADNAEDAQAVGAVLPDGGGGQVLVTSRNRDWAGAAEVLDVDALGEDEAVEYLLGRTGETERAAALSLARALGCLPLALEKAGAYVAQSPGFGLADYLEMFQAREIQLRARTGEPDVGDPPRPYPAAVAVTCTLAVERVEEVAPAAATLLRACAFLAPEAIPLSLLSGSDELPEPLADGPLAQRDALAVLARMGLARSTWPGGIAVDRVVQAVVRDHLAGRPVGHPVGRRDGEMVKGALGPWAAGVVRLVDRAFPSDSDDVATWDRCGRLASHALAVTAHDEAADLEPQATSRLLARVGIYLQGRGQLHDARHLLERALALTEIAYGPDCSEAGVHLGNLAAVLTDLGCPGDARRCLERALAIVEATHGDEHPAVATFAGDLGRVLVDLGQTGAARLCFERALRIDETVYGPVHPAVAGDLGNLALVAWGDGDTLEARRYFDEALAIDEAAYGPDDPTVARDLANLALVLVDLGEPVEAHPRLERALAIVESAFGPGHPEVGAHLINLAMVAQDCGHLGPAQTYLERALVIAEESDGPGHPAVAAVLNNLGTVLSHLGESARARECFDRALAIDEAALGPEHPETDAIRGNRQRLLQMPAGDDHAG